MTTRLTLRTNIASIQAQRRLGSSTEALRETFTRLSSGLRINTASDDAAGLAVMNALEVDRRVYDQGVRNINDGISLLSIADAAISELTNITTRIAELAEQSANGTLSSVQRQALDKEAQALRAEYLRIIKTTEFNNKNLFDQEFGQLRIQAGYGELGGILSDLGGSIGTGALGDLDMYSTGGTDSYGVTSADFNGDGVMDIVTANQGDNSVSVLLGVGDGTFDTAVTYDVGAGPISVLHADVNNDGIFDLVSTDRGDNAAGVLLGNGDGTFGNFNAYSVGTTPIMVTAGDVNNDGKVDIVSADLASDTLSVLLGVGDGSFIATTSVYLGAGAQLFEVELVDLNNDNILDIIAVDENGPPASAHVYFGNGDGTFAYNNSYTLGNSSREVAVGDFNADGVLDFVTADYTSDSVTLYYGTGGGQFGNSQTLNSGNGVGVVKVADFNGDGYDDIISSSVIDADLQIFLANEDGSFAAPVTYDVTVPRDIAINDFDGDGVLDVASVNNTGARVEVLLSETTTGIGALIPVDLTTAADARQSLSVLTNQINQLASQRSVIGAFESRLEVARNNALIASENFATAASQIRDADVAIEAAELVRRNILQQSAAAVLAQANLQPQLVLSLLDDLSS